MKFNYNKWFWSQQTDEYLYNIINGKGLEYEKLMANKEINKRVCK